MDDPESVLVAGYKLDRYELLCPIASGGMATVWLARLRGKRGFEKLFAVKMIKTEHTSDPRFQEMFLDEARIASAIEHPNVAQILDLGEQDGLLYTVMEWVDGESLAKISRVARKRGTPMPVGVALRIVADACAGLHAAHELRDADDARLGVVHRDVSPQNILVTTNGAVKVIDFGVAKAVNRRGVDTQSGVVKGKIRYLAPEQVAGKARDVDHRVDLWAAGVCLYELVTGKAPWDELNDVDVIRQLMSDEPVPSLDGVPEALGPIFASTLARDPNARFATAAALRRAIESTLDGMRASVSSEDVADFLKDKLPDLAKNRRATVTKAIEDAKERAAKGGDVPSAASSGALPSTTGTAGAAGAAGTARAATDADVAFAPTIASAPRAKGHAGGAATRGPGPNRDPSTRATLGGSGPGTRARDESGPKTTAGATLSDQVGERRSSFFPWVFAAVVLGGVGASIWYANERLRIAAATVAPAASASGAASTSAVAAASASGASSVSFAASAASGTSDPASSPSRAGDAVEEGGASSSAAASTSVSASPDAAADDAATATPVRRRPLFGPRRGWPAATDAPADAGPRRPSNPTGDEPATTPPDLVP